MKTRLLPVMVTILALAGFLASAVMAAEIDGTVDKAGAGKITVKNKDAKLETFDVDAEAKITLDGKTVKLEDLKSGTAVTVVTEVVGSKTRAVSITGKSTG